MITDYYSRYTEGMETPDVEIGDVVWVNQPKGWLTRLRGLFVCIDGYSQEISKFELIDGICDHFNGRGSSPGALIFKWRGIPWEKMTMKNTGLSLSELRRVKKIARQYRFTREERNVS